MNYIKIQNTWNDRLRENIESTGLSQKELAKDFNDKLNTSCTQNGISRWISVGNKKIDKNGKETEIGFPSFQSMLTIAQYFDKSVSYFIGEIDQDSYALKSICEYFDLNQDAIKALQKLTNFHAPHSKVWQTGGKSKDVIQKMLLSDKFFNFICSMSELDDIYNGPDKSNKLYKELQKKYNDETLEIAFKIHDDVYDLENSKYSDEILSAVCDVNELIDKMYKNDTELDYKTDVMRYRLQNAFNDLINNLYPKHKD